MVSVALYFVVGFAFKFPQPSYVDIRTDNELFISVCRLKENGIYLSALCKTTHISTINKVRDLFNYQLVLLVHIYFSFILFFDLEIGFQYSIKSTFHI